MAYKFGNISVGDNSVAIIPFHLDYAYNLDSISVGNRSAVLLLPFGDNGRNIRDHLAEIASNLLDQLSGTPVCELRQSNNTVDLKDGQPVIIIRK